MDFADVRTIMGDAGTALMGIGRGSGTSSSLEFNTRQAASSASCVLCMLSLSACVRASLDGCSRHMRDSPISHLACEAAQCSPLSSLILTFLNCDTHTHTCMYTHTPYPTSLPRSHHIAFMNQLSIRQVSSTGGSSSRDIFTSAGFPNRKGDYISLSLSLSLFSSISLSFSLSLYVSHSIYLPFVLSLSLSLSLCLSVFLSFSL